MDYYVAGDLLTLLSKFGDGIPEDMLSSTCWDGDGWPSIQSTDWDSLIHRWENTTVST